MRCVVVLRDVVLGKAQVERVLLGNRLRNIVSLKTHMLSYLLIDFYGHFLVLIAFDNLVKVKFLHHFALLLLIFRLLIELNTEESSINVVVLVLLKTRYIALTLLLLSISTLDDANVT